MTIGDIYEYLKVELNKHKSGNSYAPKDFNYVLANENINFFNHKVEQMQMAANSDKNFREMLLSSKILRKLLVTEAITPSTGVYTLTGLANTFVHWASCLTVAVFNGGIKAVELITHNELEERFMNLLKPPVKYNPVCVLVGDTAKYYPTNITQMNLTYIKLPSTPVFDYYIDANRNIIFLAEGGSRVLTTGQVGSLGQTVGTTVTSLTNELDFGQEFYPEFTDYLLVKLSIRSKEPLLTQVALNERK